MRPAVLGQAASHPLSSTPAPAVHWYQACTAYRQGPHERQRAAPPGSTEAQASLPLVEELGSSRAHTGLGQRPEALLSTVENPYLLPLLSSERPWSCQEVAHGWGGERRGEELPQAAVQAPLCQTLSRAAVE